MPLLTAQASAPLAEVSKEKSSSGIEPAALFDIDTPDALQTWRRRSGADSTGD